jgi:hypothetical protein
MQCIKHLEKYLKEIQATRPSVMFSSSLYRLLFANLYLKIKRVFNYCDIETIELQLIPS